MSATIEDLEQRWGPSYRYIVTCTLMLGTLSALLSSTIVNVAIPQIMGVFGIGQDRAQWLSTAFLTAMTASMLLNSWALQRWGARLTYVVGMAAFAGASVLGGLSPDENILILSRIFQGAAVGIIQPLTMVVMFQVFPPEQRGRAMGLYGMGVVLGPAVGPALGGWLIDEIGWRSVFFVGLPICAAAIPLGLLFAPGRDPDEPPIRLDWTGLILLCTFLGFLLTWLSNESREGWDDAWIQTYLAIALVTGGGFLYWEMQTADPMINLRLFKYPEFSAVSIVGFIFGAGIYGSTYLVPLFSQIVQGLSPTEAGIMLMPAGLVLTAIFPFSGRLSDHLPLRWPMLIGLMLFSLSVFLMKYADVNTPFATLVGWIIIGRVGLAVVMPAMNVAALRSIPDRLMSQASGSINFTRQLGGAFGVNLLAILVESRTAFHTEDNFVTREILGDLGRMLAATGLSPLEESVLAMRYLARTIYLQASSAAFQDGFLAIAVLFLVGLIPAWMVGWFEEPAS
ncbi:MAG: DHA2 family efflux MFS transporter permease subunit [Deltaproteobacteria bacterium]|nr:DHA2 family efflux MFS transporter permease subunit [Deltaproteobacteria bacterium]